MKKHVLILGSSGMLGHVVNLHLRSLPHHFDVTDISRKNHLISPNIELDLTDFNELEEIYFKLRPDNNAEKNPLGSILINSYLPHFLKKITSNCHCKVIHISTDCVFSGSKGNYSENDFRDADNFYGRTKAMGEIPDNKNLTIRTSIVGPELNTNGIGLFHWFSKQSGEIQGFTDVFWTGVTTLELSKSIVACIKNEITGLYHMVNTVKISKYELLLYFIAEFSKTSIKNLEKNGDYSYDKSLLNSRHDLSYKVPSYEEMIKDMKIWIINHPEIYPHYQNLI
jgi:dTDP-4-dehydrorhamnose reductase